MDERKQRVAVKFEAIPVSDPLYGISFLTSWKLKESCLGLQYSDVSQ